MRKRRDVWGLGEESGSPVPMVSVGALEVTGLTAPVRCPQDKQGHVVVVVDGTGALQQQVAEDVQGPVGEGRGMLAQPGQAPVERLPRRLDQTVRVQHERGQRRQPREGVGARPDQARAEQVVVFLVQERDGRRA